ncbi:hypothetical protein ACC734_39285, partial [Rhizobium ruizarguesonis]
PIFLNTNLLRSDRLALSLFAKDETENPIRSFKGRGTGYFLAHAARHCKQAPDRNSRLMP